MFRSEYQFPLGKPSHTNHNLHNRQSLNLIPFLLPYAEHVGISKKEVAAVFETMGAMMAADLKKGNAGVFNVPGLMKVTVQRKPATKARKGINPFTGEPTIFKAKPARNVVKVRPLKGLKDMVA